MRIETARGASADFRDNTHQSVPVGSSNAGSSNRALMILPLDAATNHREPAVSPHRQAAFLAHLIATKTQVPQTRARRRATPDEAIAAYRAVAKTTR